MAAAASPNLSGIFETDTTVASNSCSGESAKGSTSCADASHAVTITPSAVVNWRRALLRQLYFRFSLVRQRVVEIGITPCIQRGSSIQFGLFPVKKPKVPLIVEGKVGFRCPLSDLADAEIRHGHYRKIDYINKLCRAVERTP